MLRSDIKMFLNIDFRNSFLYYNKDIIEEYPVVSLEYRYLKDSKKEKEDNDNYVVFKKTIFTGFDI